MSPESNFLQPLWRRFGVDIVDVEVMCESFIRQRIWLTYQGEQIWPDGTVAGRYAFIHALYQEILYEHVTAAQRVQLHRRIGEREESGYRGQTETIATALAVHF